MVVELKGKIKVIYDVEVFSEALSKREIVITIDNDKQYPQDITCQALNKKLPIIDKIQVGDNAIVKCDIRGKETKGKYYNQLVIWDIIKK